MDGAWALYEAWVKIQMGDADIALVYAFGKPSMGDLPEVLTLQLDPVHADAALARRGQRSRRSRRALCLDAGVVTERDLAEVAVRDRARREEQPVRAASKGDFEVEKLLAEPYLVSPLRKHDCPPISRRRVGDRDRGRRRRAQASASARPGSAASTTRIEPHDARRARPHALALDASSPARRPASGKGTVDVAELHAPFTHQELILRERRSGSARR